MMRSAILSSVAAHIAIIVIGWVGLPMLRKPPPITEVPIVVDMVPLDVYGGNPEWRAEVKRHHERRAEKRRDKAASNVL